MKNGSKWKVRKVLVFISGALLLTLAAYIIILHILIPKKIYQQLREISPTLRITYTSLRTSLFASAVTLNDLDIVFTPDTTKKELSHHLHFSKARLKEINFFKLATSKDFSLNAIELDQADISLDSFLLEKNDSVMNLAKLNLPFKKLLIGHLQLQKAKFYLHSGRSKKLIAAGDVSLNGVNNLSGSNFKFDDIYSNLSNINYTFPGQQTLHVQKLIADSKKEILKIDSLIVLSGSEHNKITELSQVEIAGIDLKKLPDKNITAGEVYLHHIKATSVDEEEIKKLIGPVALQLSILHFKADDITFGSQNKVTVTSGTIDIQGLQINKPDSSFSTDSIRFSSLACDFSNINYPLDANRVAAIRHFIIDSKKRKLQIEDLKIENSEGQIESAIGQMKLNDFDVQNIMHKKLIAGELIIQNVKATGPTSSPFNSINDRSFYVNINEVKVNGISISYRNNELRCKGDLAIQGLTIEKLNKSFTPDSLRFADLHCNLSDVSYLVAEELHEVQISKLMIDSKEKIIQIESLKTIPQYDKFEYGRRRGYQGSWVKATVSHIKILNADIQNLFHQKLIADKMIIGGSNVYVFRDRRLQRKLRNQMLPVAYMKQLPVDIRIKSLELEPSFVAYEEFPRYWIRTGTLKLMKMQMTLSPFINHPRTGDPDHMDLYASGSVMGSGTASAHFKMPLDGPEVYYVKGRFEDLSLPSLNSTAENLGVFSIRSGFLNFLTFEFTMTPQRAKGKIVGEYHDLVIDKLKIDDQDSTRKEKAGFSSFMLHHVIIPRDKDLSMPEGKRTGTVDYLRDPTRFVTYYFIKSLLDGIRSSFTFGFVLPK